MTEPDEEERGGSSLPDLTSLGLSGTAIVLDTAGGGGWFTFLAGAAQLASDQIDDERLEKVADRSLSNEERIAALEETDVRVRRVEGDAYRVLTSTVRAQLRGVDNYAGVDEVMDEWDLTADEYREAARELEALGLVRAHPGGNSPSGISRTALEPEAFLRLAPALLDDVDVGKEFLRVLELVEEPEDDLVPANDVLEESGVPLPRFDLYVRAGEALELLEGHSGGVSPYWRHFWLSVAPLGGRVLRGDDPPPAGLE